jgi:CPA2 family monovalent cation:H+ antiporter-2
VPGNSLERVPPILFFSFTTYPRESIVTVEGLFLAKAIAVVGAFAFVNALLRKHVFVQNFAFVVAGFVLGPHAVSLLNASDSFNLAEFGASILLFGAAMEFGLAELLSFRKRIIATAVAQLGLVLCITLVAAMSYCGASFKEALFLGLLLSLSSTAVALKSLDSQGLTFGMLGVLTVGILVLQDILVVPYSMVSQMLSGQGATLESGQWWPYLGKVLYGFVILGVVLAASHFVFRLLTRKFDSLSDTSVLSAATIVFLLGLAVAHETGQSYALGAFLAGLGISQFHQGTRELRRITHKIGESSFGVFLLALGAFVDPLTFVRFPIQIFVVVLALIILKVISAGVVLSLCKTPLRVAFGVGLATATVGEFSFVLANQGLSQGLLGQATYQLFIASALATVILAPALLGLVPQIDRLFGSYQLFARKLKGDSTKTPAPLCGHTVLCGFGPTSQTLINALSGFGNHPLSTAVILIERSPANIMTASQQAGCGTTFSAIRGDFSKRQMLIDAQVGAARFLVLSSGTVAEQILAIEETLRLEKEYRRVHPKRKSAEPEPELIIAVRCRFQSDEERLSRAGAHVVVSDERAASVLLTQTIGKPLGVPELVLSALTE